MANDALLVNPDRYSQLGITTHGSNWLWAVFAIMLFVDLIVMAWHFTIPHGQRVFHQISIIILSTAAIAYFSMASNLGSTPIAAEFAYEGYPIGVLRQIWYVRYIDWVVTTPALLLELTLASGLPLSDIITLIFFDLVMIITGLVGALVASSYKWGYYTFGCVALFYIWWVLIGPARTSAGLLGAEYKKSFTHSAAILSFLWLLYPVAWGLADGSSLIHPDSEMIFYGVLDVLAKPVFILFHLYSLSKLDLTALQLSSGKFTSSAAAVTSFDREKHPRGADIAPGAAPVGAPNAGTSNYGKKGLFARKGRFDAVNPATEPVGQHNVDIAPRTSEATVISR